MEVRWASPRPSKARLKGKSGGVCGVRLSYFNPNPGVPRRVPSLPYNVDTLKSFQCVFEGTLGFTATLGTPVQSIERRCRWGAPQLLSALFLVSGRCSGVPRRVPSLSHAVDTLWTLRCIFEGTLDFTVALGSPVQRQERRCLWGAPQLLSALLLVSERCPGVPRRAPSLSHTVSTLWILRCVFGGTLGFTVALGSLVQRQERRCLWGAPQLLSALSLLSERCSGVTRRVPSLPHTI